MLQFFHTYHITLYNSLNTDNKLTIIMHAPQSLRNNLINNVSKDKRPLCFTITSLKCNSHKLY